MAAPLNDSQIYFKQLTKLGLGSDKQEIKGVIVGAIEIITKSGDEFTTYYQSFDQNSKTSFLENLNFVKLTIEEKSSIHASASAASAGSQSIRPDFEQLYTRISQMANRVLQIEASSSSKIPSLQEMQHINHIKSILAHGIMSPKRYASVHTQTQSNPQTTSSTRALSADGQQSNDLLDEVKFNIFPVIRNMDPEEKEDRLIELIDDSLTAPSRGGLSVAIEKKGEKPERILHQITEEDQTTANVIAKLNKITGEKALERVKKLQQEVSPFTPQVVNLFEKRLSNTALIFTTIELMHLHCVSFDNTSPNAPVIDLRSEDPSVYEGALRGSLKKEGIEKIIVPAHLKAFSEKFTLQELEKIIFIDPKKPFDNQTIHYYHTSGNTTEVDVISPNYKPALLELLSTKESTSGTHITRCALLIDQH
jgi:hypothetical protein